MKLKFDRKCKMPTLLQALMESELSDLREIKHKGGCRCKNQEQRHRQLKISKLSGGIKKRIQETSIFQLVKHTHTVVKNRVRSHSECQVTLGSCLCSCHDVCLQRWHHLKCPAQWIQIHEGIEMNEGRMLYSPNTKSLKISDSK